MTNKIEISLRIPSDAQSHKRIPYMEHKDFITYCKANKVDASEGSLEAYEKKGLLYPCFRVLYPRELLRREFRANHHPYKDYKSKNEWEPLVELETVISNSRYWDCKECDEAIENDQPLEQALKKGNPFVFNPEMQKFKAWNRYKVIEGEIGGSTIKRSRAKHYYSTWKIFLIHDLNGLNTDEHNRATGCKLGWGIIDSNLRPSQLAEFSPFFKIVASFSYRRALLHTKYFGNQSQTQNDWDAIVKKQETLAKALFPAFEYKKWVRFLRKLIELYENYKEDEKYLLAEEVKAHLVRTVVFMKFATDSEFQKICDDVSGIYKDVRGMGFEEGVSIHPGQLERMFPDERWDLKQNVRWILEHELDSFNTALIEAERIPVQLCEQLFDELMEEPEGTALAAIRKINKAYSDSGLWQDDEIWSGIRGLTVSLENHGKEWFNGKTLDGVLTSLFPQDYRSLKKITGKDNVTFSHNTREFIDTLQSLENNSTIPVDRRCGRHLLVTHLVRNYASHLKGLSGNDLRKWLSLIYTSSVRTLFVAYARYKGL